MTIDQAIRKASAEISSVFDQNMIAFEDMLRARGATNAEIATEIEIHQADFDRWHRELLADLRGRLERDGECLH